MLHVSKTLGHEIPMKFHFCNVLIMIVSADGDPGLRTESFSIINKHGGISEKVISYYALVHDANLQTTYLS